MADIFDEITSDQKGDVFDQLTDIKPAAASPPGPDFSKFLATPQATIAAENLRGGVREALTQAPPLLGAALGATVGAASPVPGGAIAGGALGYSIGKQISEPPSTAVEGFRRMPGELAAGAAFEMGGQSFNALVARYGKPVADVISRTVKRSMQKLRPKGAPPQLYFDEAETAVKEIVANQGALNLTDEAGNAVAGLPRTVPQFEQAINQTKKIVFNRYDVLAKQSGDAGLSVGLEGAAKELEAFAKDTINKVMNPKLAKYARERAKFLREQGFFTPSEAQDAVMTANSSAKLKARYDKRGVENPDLTREATVDALEANLLRRELDNVVTNATGESYQELKNTYGALKSIEDDVRKRAAVQARQNVKGFFDIGEFYSGAELARFLVTADPTALAMSIGAKAPGMIAKYLNSPNRYVRNMFSEVERLMASPEFQASVPPARPIPLSSGETREAMGTVPGKPGRRPGIPGQGPPSYWPQQPPSSFVGPLRIGDIRLVPVPGQEPTRFSLMSAREPSGQAPRPAVSPGPEPNIGPPAWQAPQIVTSPGVAPPASKVGAPLKTAETGEGTQARIPPKPEGGRIHGKFKVGNKEYTY